MAWVACFWNGKRCQVSVSRRPKESGVLKRRTQNENETRKRDEVSKELLGSRLICIGLKERGDNDQFEMPRAASQVGGTAIELRIEKTCSRAENGHGALSGC